MASTRAHTGANGCSCPKASSGPPCQMSRHNADAPMTVQATDAGSSSAQDNRPATSSSITPRRTATEPSGLMSPTATNGPRNQTTADNTSSANNASKARNTGPLKKSFITVLLVLNVQGRLPQHPRAAAR